MGRRLAAALLVVLLAAGSASAYHGKPGRAGVLASGPVALTGDLAASAQPAAVLYEADGELRLSVVEGSVRATVTEVRERAGLLATVLPPPEAVTTVVEGGSLDVTSRGGASNVLVYTHGGLAQFRYASDAAILLRADAGPVAPTRAALDGGMDVAARQARGFEHAAAAPEVSLLAAGGALEALGDFSLFVYDAVVVVGGQAIVTGSSTDPSGERVVRWVDVDLRGARLVAEDRGALAHFRAPLADVALNGTATFSAARGSAAVDSADPNLAGDVASLDGVMTLGARPTDDGLRLDAQGDFVAVTVGGVRSSFAAPVAAAGALAVLAAAAWAAWPSLKTAGAAALYARFGGPEVLRHEGRDRTLSHVREHPGASVKEVADAVGISWSTAAYHLEVLAREGFLARHQSGRHRRYFATGAPADRDAIALLHDPTARRLVDLVRDAPGRSQKELAALVGVSASTASWQLRRLVAAGVLVEERAWRRVAYRPREP